MRRPAPTRRTSHIPTLVEKLEPRILLSGNLPCITLIEADNRGLIELFLSRDLNPSTVTNSAVEVFTAGEDGLLATPDDALASFTVTYSNAERKISIDANIEPGERYAVRVDGDLIRDTLGQRLDAEFNGPDQDTGDGVEGGILEFYPRVGEQNIVRFRTILGDIYVQMFTQDTPLTVENFFNYMNRGDYDQTIIHRNASLGDGTPFVVQGGGFQSDVRFSNVPTDPPVLNEPGISNTRGTIAMAKLGGDPNSATNQWFFNIGNNSQNLDNQNGGFTVFGEVLDQASLDIMDALAALDTVDATSLNGAFNELPVVDADLVNNRDPFAVFPSDTARIFRIAQQLEIEAEPFAQIETQNSIVFTSQNLQTTVTVFSLTGASLGDPNDFMRVDFGSGSNVSSIQITGNIPAPIGIQISGASNVRSFQDNRRNDDANLRFVVSNTAIDSIKLSHSIRGENINATLLANNTLLPEDIDNDGMTSDPTAVYVLDGSISSLQTKGDLTGSVVASGAIQNVKIQGTTRDADFSFGSAPTSGATSFRFASVYDSTLSTDTPISSLTANEWITQQRFQTNITAPSIDSLKIRGGRDIDGNIEANLNLTGNPDGRVGLAKATISGALMASNWTVAGGANTIKIKGFTNNWTFTSTGNVNNIQAEQLIATDLAFTGVLGSLKTNDWFLGSLEAQSVINIQIKGGRDFDGDLVADLDIGQTEGTSIRSLKVAGDLRDASIAATGDIRSLRIGADVEDSSINAESLRDLRLGLVTNTDLTVSNDMNLLSASEWDGGSINVTFVNGVNITGDRKRGLDGNLLADFNGNLINTVSVAGNLESDFSAFEVRSFIVQGDVTDSQVVFQQSFFGNFAAASIFIRGAVINSTIAATGLVDSITVGALSDTMILAGTNNINQFGFPSNNSGFDRNIGIRNIDVLGVEGVASSMSNSFILSGFLERVRVINPEINNPAFPHGVAAIRFNQPVEILSDNQRFTIPTDRGPDALGSFEVRANFRAP